MVDSNKPFHFETDGEEQLALTLGYGLKRNPQGEWAISPTAPYANQWLEVVADEDGDAPMEVYDHIHISVSCCDQPEEVVYVVLHPHDFVRSVMDNLINPANVRYHGDQIWAGSTFPIGNEGRGVWLITMPEESLKALSPEGIGYTIGQAVFDTNWQRLKDNQGQY